MATARGLSMIFLLFLLSLLVASRCLVDEAHGLVLGKTTTMTHLQEQPGTGQYLFVKLEANTLLVINCQLQSSSVGGNSWWLDVEVASQKTGYVALHDSECYGYHSNCDQVRHC